MSIKRPAHANPTAIDGDTVALKPCSAIDGWNQDDMRPALACLATMTSMPTDRQPKGENHGVRAVLAKLAHEAAQIVGSADASQAKTFFEHRFGIVANSISENRGFVTGYYEPLLDASPHPTERFAAPLFAPPRDLGAHRESDRPYLDRASIEAGGLAGRGLEIAFLDNAIDAFFVHVQGSAALRMPDGEVRRVGFAAKNRHAYQSIGKLLIERGEIAADQMSMDRLRRWLLQDLPRAQRLMNENRSYIFFRFLPDHHTAGPLGAAGVALTPGRSLAVDANHLTYGTPVWIATKDKVDALGHPIRRLMIAMDTGSAISGPFRGDIFWGTGDSAGLIAGQIRHECDFLPLLPLQQGQLRNDTAP